MTEWPQSLALVGAGKMGGAMLKGWLDGGLAPARIMLVDPAPSPEIATLAAAHSIALNPPPAARTAPEVLVLAVKPQMLDAAAPELASLGKRADAGSVDHRRQDHRQSRGAAAGRPRLRSRDAQYASGGRARHHRRRRQRRA